MDHHLAVFGVQLGEKQRVLFQSQQVEAVVSLRAAKEADHLPAIGYGVEGRDGGVLSAGAGEGVYPPAAGDVAGVQQVDLVTSGNESEIGNIVPHHSLGR